MYAYKGDLGIFDSLLENNQMPLWKRDGKRLLQKYFRVGYENNCLLYKSSMIYNVWDPKREHEYLQIPTIVAENNRTNIIIMKLVDPGFIESICSREKFSLLNLPPYKCFQGELTEDMQGFKNIEKLMEIDEPEKAKVDMVDNEYADSFDYEDYEYDNE